MATVKTVPPTHPTVYIGLGLAAVGLLLAVYAYTGARVYDILYAVVALVGGLLALLGILTAAWGRAIMTSRASRERRAAKHGAPAAEATAETAPTIATPRSKRAFDFKRSRKQAPPQESASAAGVFAFKRREAPEPAPVPAPEPAPVTERVTVKCPDCGSVLTAEGVRPLEIVCACGFKDTV